MLDNSSPPLAPPAPRPASAATPVTALNREETYKLFKGLVVTELEVGFLRYSRRKALIDYAARLGIPEFQATLLIAEAQFHSDQIEPVRFDSDFTLNSFARPDTWSVSLRLSFALVTAIFIDLLLIWWLFH